MDENPDVSAEEDKYYAGPEMTSLAQNLTQTLELNGGVALTTREFQKKGPPPTPVEVFFSCWRSHGNHGLEMAYGASSPKIPQPPEASHRICMQICQKHFVIFLKSQLRRRF